MLPRLCHVSDQRDVALRVMPSRWPLRDAGTAASLQCSIIWMRNALPRAEAAPAS
jgi:hypothetical protein